MPSCDSPLFQLSHLRHLWAICKTTAWASLLQSGLWRGWSSVALPHPPHTSPCFLDTRKCPNCWNVGVVCEDISTQAQSVRSTPSKPQSFLKWRWPPLFLQLPQLRQLVTQEWSGVELWCWCRWCGACAKNCVSFSHISSFSVEVARHILSQRWDLRLILLAVKVVELNCFKGRLHVAICTPMISAGELYQAYQAKDMWHLFDSSSVPWFWLCGQEKE